MVLHRMRRAVAARLRPAAPLSPPPTGTLRVTATGRRAAEARGNEVIILEARSSSGLVVDLPRLAAPGVETMREIVVDGQRPVAVGLKLLPGATLDLALGQRGSLQLLCHPWSGEVRLETSLRSVLLDLFAARPEPRRIDIAELLPLLVPPGCTIQTSDGVMLDHVLAEARRYLAALAPRRTMGDRLDTTLAIYTPRWRGVSAATRNLFRCTLGVPLTPEEHPDDIESGYVAAIAEAVLEAAFDIIVFSGGDPALFALARRLKDIRPSLSIRLLWHGSYLQMGEAHDWHLFRPWLDACQTGIIDGIGVVKPGMDAFLQGFGVRACFLQNSVPFDRAALARTAASASDVDDVAGLWLSGSSEYRKAPYAVLLALAGLPRFSLRAAGLGELGFRMVEELGIRTAARFAEPIAHAQVLREMRQTSLTLYITLSECMPMVPLESIACGVPCIVGPATRFYDLPYLQERLMVENPTDPHSIRRTILAAIDERAEVLRQSLAFLERIAVRAEACLTRFLA